MLYKASRDGWENEDFHKRCDDKGSTLTIIRSSVGKIFGGYASKSWKSPPLGGMAKKDPNAFIFSIDHKTVYRPTDPDKALYFNKNRGPVFGVNSLTLQFGTMNEKNNGYCHTNGYNSSFFKVECDAEGNNKITGEGKDQKGDEKKYTCTGLEVYKVIY